MGHNVESPASDMGWIRPGRHRYELRTGLEYQTPQQTNIPDTAHDFLLLWKSHDIGHMLRKYRDDHTKGDFGIGLLFLLIPYQPVQFMRGASNLGGTG